MKNFPSIEPQWSGPVAGFDFKKENPVKVLQRLDEFEHMQCWPKDKIPAQYRLGSHRRVPKIVCLAELGWTISFKPQATLIKGGHGFDPEEIDMHGLFIVSGKNIRQTTLGLIPNVDIYPLLTRMLEIVPESNDANDWLFDQIVN
jgi:predicted AlkP superfamily pyrophosphatase or phosphodiesterase